MAGGGRWVDLPRTPESAVWRGSHISWQCQGSWGDGLLSALASYSFDAQAVLADAGWLSSLASFQDTQRPPRPLCAPPPQPLL